MPEHPFSLVGSAAFCPCCLAGLRLSCLARREVAREGESSARKLSWRTQVHNPSSCWVRRPSATSSALTNELIRVQPCASIWRWDGLRGRPRLGERRCESARQDGVSRYCFIVETLRIEGCGQAQLREGGWQRVDWHRVQSIGMPTQQCC
eukprot:scaffold263232_cov32-Tisochrysis_lutea.AAC.4